MHIAIRRNRDNPSIVKTKNQAWYGFSITCWIIHRKPISLTTIIRFLQYSTLIRTSIYFRWYMYCVVHYARNTNCFNKKKNQDKTTFTIFFPQTHYCAGDISNGKTTQSRPLTSSESPNSDTNMFELKSTWLTQKLSIQQVSPATVVFWTTWARMNWP